MTPRLRTPLRVPKFCNSCEGNLPLPSPLPLPPSPCPSFSCFL
jgi:hypothetical protein